MNYKVIQVETEGDIGVFADRLDRSTGRERENQKPAGRTADCQESIKALHEKRGPICGPLNRGILSEAAGPIPAAF
jgi:hypothetical protein